ncbi:MAG TPA: hypothetical protein VJH03_16575 [Blastocatellia bacterium]|nr:hypothetical protein [Blastocatellia bacterium]
MSAVGTKMSTGREADSQQSLRVRCIVEGAARVCRLLDLRPNYLFVESFLPAVTGSQVSFQLRLPSGHQIETAGRVSYHQIGVGFGADLTDLSPSDRAEIASAGF